MAAANRCRQKFPRTDEMTQLYRCPPGIEMHRTHSPTATFIFDIRAATQDAPPVYPTYQQEATYVTSLSDY
jgi:hypothetical protein